MRVDKNGNLTSKRTLGERITDPGARILDTVAVLIFVGCHFAFGASLSLAIGWLIGMTVGWFLWWNVDGRPREVEDTTPPALDFEKGIYTLDGRRDGPYTGGHRMVDPGDVANRTAPKPPTPDNKEFKWENYR